MPFRGLSIWGMHALPVRENGGRQVVVLRCRGRDHARLFPRFRARFFGAGEDTLHPLRRRQEKLPDRIFGMIRGTRGHTVIPRTPGEKRNVSFFSFTDVS